MRIADVLDRSGIKAVTVGPEVSLAKAAQLLHGNDTAAIIVDDGRFRGTLTAGDILRILTLAASPAQVWQSPIANALCEKVAAVTPEERVGRAIERMTAAGVNHLPVTTASGTVVVSLCQLLQVANTQLHDELHHLQTYIDALHDAPND